MQKIYVGKNDPIALIIEKIIKSSSEEVVLYVSRGSLLVSSRNNFKLLKRETESAGKILSIESVDDDVLELADSFNIKAINPFFGKKKSVMDIVVKDSKSSLVRKSAILEVKKEKSELWIDGPIIAEEFNKPSILRRVVKLLIIIGLAMILGWVAVYILPQATIKLTLEKINWDFSGSMSVSSFRETPSFTGNTIELPGVIFNEKKNLTKTYGVSGSEYIEKKASGVIAVYNEYSSESQVLARNTRFSTPDGKIYRADKKVIVPGAKIVNGKIISSSIDLTIIAEKAGEEYNIGSVPKFRIPGFQGSPKYDAFYGVGTSPIVGGFVGEIKMPTEDDIVKAKEDLRVSLQGALKTIIFLGIPTDIKVLDKSYEFSITKEEINKEVDTSGNFTVTGFGEIKVIGFKEIDLLSALANKVAAESNIDLVLYDHSLKESSEGYSEPRLDFANGKMVLDLNFKSSWARPFNIEEFKAQAAGKNASEITSLIYSVQGFKSGGVDLWPIWVRRVPQNTKKIIVDLDYIL